MTRVDTTTTTTSNCGNGKRLIPRREVKLEEFLALDVPHPYGVQPEGNRFLQTTGDTAVTANESSTQTTETTTTISPTDLLTDECWNSILQFCNGVDLARVGQTCRYFYVSSHLPELWRDLVLHKLHHHNNGQQQQQQQKEQVLTHFYHSWKGTLFSH
jgi:hypothetical protein